VTTQTAERLKVIAAMKEDGATLKQIGEAVGLSPSRVSQLATEYDGQCTDAGWGICDECWKERRLKDTGRMVEHRRHNRIANRMVRCEGSGRFPVWRQADEAEPEPEREAWPPRR
jgi:hypothetical protein